MNTFNIFWPHTKRHAERLINDMFEEMLIMKA